MDKVALYHIQYMREERLSIRADVREQKRTHLLSLLGLSRPLQSMSTCQGGGHILSTHFGLHGGVGESQKILRADCQGYYPLRKGEESVQHLTLNPSKIAGWVSKR